MQTIVLLFAIFWFMMTMVSAKPKAYKANQHIQFTRGKIIGGQDAPARK